MRSACGQCGAERVCTWGGAAPPSPFPPQLACCRPGLPWLPQERPRLGRRPAQEAGARVGTRRRAAQAAGRAGAWGWRRRRCAMRCVPVPQASLMCQHPTPHAAACLVLAPALQRGTDPDEIFNPQNHKTCTLDEVFANGASGRGGGGGGGGAGGALPATGPAAALRGAAGGRSELQMPSLARPTRRQEQAGPDAAHIQRQLDRGPRDVAGGDELQAGHGLPQMSGAGLRARGPRAGPRARHPVVSTQHCTSASQAL